MKKYLVQRVADHAEGGEPQPLAGGDPGRRVEDVEDAVRAVGTPFDAASERTHARDDGEERDGRDDHPHRVERLRLQLSKSGLDDDEVGAPDDRHQEQKGVDAVALR